MTLLQIPLDEPVANVLRELAAAQGKSIETWAVETMNRMAVPVDSADWLEEYIATALQAGGNSRGWKWNRDELYE